MQGNKLLLAIVSGLAAITIATPALAVMSSPNGWYVEGNIGSTHLSNTNFNGSTSSSGMGGNVNLGYKFMPYAGAELGYTEYAHTSINAADGSRAAKIRHGSYDIAARATLPVADSGVEAFAKLGAQRSSAHVNITNDDAASTLNLTGSTHSTTGAYMGLGAQIYFTPEFAAVAQWQRAQGSSSTGTEDLFTIGLSFLIV